MDELIKRFYDLPSIPRVVQELIESFSDQHNDVSKISKKIQSDPAITAKVLRLANSARYGAGRKVASIDNAVVLLGFDTLKTLIIASGVTSSLKYVPGLDMKVFWRKSFMVANICKLIAKNAPNFDPETAFTCGMLHKIGLALMFLGHNEQITAIRHRVEHEGAIQTEEEQKIFGYNNCAVAAQLAKFWNFPVEIHQALAFQHEPQSAEQERQYAIIIHLGKLINLAIEAHAPIDEIVPSLPKQLIAAINVDTLGLYESIKALTEAEDDIDDMLAA